MSVTSLHQAKAMSVTLLPQAKAMSVTSLPLEIIVCILEQLPLKDVIKLSCTDKEMREIIKNVRLPHMIKLKKNTDEKLEHIIKNYNFINFDLSYSYITDRGLEVLSDLYCRSIDLFLVVIH